MAKFLKSLGLASNKKCPPVPPLPDYSVDQCNEDLNGKVVAVDLQSQTVTVRSGSGHASAGLSLSVPVDVQDIKNVRSELRSTGDRISPGGKGGPGSPSRNSAPDDLNVRRPKPRRQISKESSPQNHATKGKVGMPLEYSDPIDSVKGQEPTGDEGYSEPYEALKALQKMREETTGMFSYDESYDAHQPPQHHPASQRQGQKSCDTRPRTDYEEPWEFTARRSAALQAHMDALEYGKRLSAQLSDTAKPWEAAGKGSPGSSRKVSNRGDLSPDNDVDEELRRHRTEFGIARSIDMDQEQFMQDAGGNYEVPWDLKRRSMELEAKLYAATKGLHSGSGGTTDKTDRSKLETDRPSVRHRTSPPTTSPPPPPTLSAATTLMDTRPTEEYEDPWDVKSKQIERQVIRAKAAKDRATKMEREPSIIETVIKQTEMVSIGSPKCGHTEGVSAESTTDEADNSRTQPLSYPRSTEVEDERPQEEYEDPWDTKARAKILSTLCPIASVESTPKSSHGSSISQTQSTSQSQSQSSSTDSPGTASGGHRKRHKLNLDLGCRSHSAQGERVDPDLPLKQQGWYHGAISRTEAENLLRVHKEGSYLVRNSESTKQDFSLSLKSAKGFMHMKIVKRDDIYILGQFSQPFDSIPQMIYHYSVYKLPIKGAEHMSLLHPVVNELL